MQKGGTMDGVMIIGGVLLLLTVIFSLIWYFDKKRTEAVKNLADSLGLEFVGNVEPSQLGEVTEFPLFQAGHSRRVRNLLQGETDIARIQIFDYQYTVGSDKNKSTHNQTVVSMVSGEIATPAFELSPEGFFSRVGHWFGGSDIDFVEHPEFSDSFQLKGPDEETIRQFFDTPLMDFFCQNKSQCVSAKQGELIYYRQRKAAKPEAWKDLMSEGFQVYQAILSRGSRH